MDTLAVKVCAAQEGRGVWYGYYSVFKRGL